MMKLSTGEDSTLGNYRKKMAQLLGEDSPAVKFLDDKIVKNGIDDEVIVPESQMIQLLHTIHTMS